MKNPNIGLLRKLEIASTQPIAPEKKKDIRAAVLKIIEAATDGISYDDLIKQSGESEQDVEKVVNDILAEGVCYEPTPGKIKKI